MPSFFTPSFSAVLKLIAWRNGDGHTMDELSRYNKERWEDLARADVQFSRPLLELDRSTAQEWLDGQGITPPGGTGEIKGKDVLCLASGGGQQSAVFGLLGASVTVFDLSETQLQRDRLAASHHGYPLRAEQGDMRDLSLFSDDSFDIVWQQYSLNFVPEAEPVFNEVARVLRHGGLYHLEIANPFITGLGEEDWDGRGYPLRQPYIDGEELIFDDPHWDVEAADGTQRRIVGPREFRHTFSSVVNTLTRLGFVILSAWECPTDGDPSAIPGTWEHFIAIAPPWLGFWMTLRPDVFAKQP